MTRFAKYLVIAQTGLSLVFLTWSLALFFESMPWVSYKKSDTETVKGRVNVLADELDPLVKARAVADARWFEATREVIRLDVAIPQRKVFYDEQIKIVTTGTDSRGQAVTPAMQKLEIRDGLVDISKKTGRPAEQIGGKDALSLAGYNAAIAKQLDDVRETKVRINLLVRDTTKLTDEINGTKPRAEAITAVERGIRGQLDDTRLVKKNAQLEQESLRSPLVSVGYTLDDLKRRQLALAARWKELSAAVFNK